MRYALIAASALCALAAQAVPQAAPKRKIPCKTPENAASCYWTHGRLAVYDGNPSWRIWKIGTTRVLGIHSAHILPICPIANILNFLQIWQGWSRQWVMAIEFSRILRSAHSDRNMLAGCNPLASSLLRIFS